jgi:hypothetical protein
MHFRLKKKIPRNEEINWLKALAPGFGTRRSRHRPRGRISYSDRSLAGLAILPALGKTRFSGRCALSRKYDS